MSPDPDELAQRLADLVPLIADVPQHRRRHAELMLARLERFVEITVRPTSSIDPQPAPTNPCRPNTGEPESENR
jgi:hypothetical protein